MKRTTMIALLTLCSGLAMAQDAKTSGANSEEPNRIFGLGVRTFNLTSDMVESPVVYPGNKILVTVNSTKFLRIQGEVGYLRVKSKSTSYKESEVDKTFSGGSGIYYMKQKEKTNLYGGPKYVYSTNEDQYLYPTGTGTNQIFTQNVSTHSYGIELGGEYLFAKHFSLGAEAGFLRCTSKSSDNYPGSGASDATFWITETNLIARFYF